MKKNMKKFILFTRPDGGTPYTYQYFIEHPEKPTHDELESFLKMNAKCKVDENVFESIDDIKEINEFLTIPKN